MSETNQFLDKAKENCYLPDFQYTTNNPYREKLDEFSHFLFQDKEGEGFKSKWSSEVFRNENPISIELGMGYGSFARHFIKESPNTNYIGLDYRFKRSFRLTRDLNKIFRSTANFRLMRAKAERIGFIFGENEINQIFLFCPDPWPKARHHKKRLFQLPFLKDSWTILKPGGTLEIKTDHGEYFTWMCECIEALKSWAPQITYKLELMTCDLYGENSLHSLAQYQTHFEKIFLRKKIKIKAIVLRKVGQ